MNKIDMNNLTDAQLNAMNEHITTDYSAILNELELALEACKDIHNRDERALKTTKAQYAIKSLKKMMDKQDKGMMW